MTSKSFLIRRAPTASVASAAATNSQQQQPAGMSQRAVAMVTAIISSQMWPWPQEGWVHPIKNAALAYRLDGVSSGPDCCYFYKTRFARTLVAVYILLMVTILFDLLRRARVLCFINKRPPQSSRHPLGGNARGYGCWAREISFTRRRL